ncbi:hypothetical protein K0M31_009135 [Melipona bicolor]|uniref:Uncharacterized protein n=1 Tax=Melipona bicolor TaxID=60889 RepID=A0AA40FNZ6_9HYME|nr:hypothetical protein K0M31_009135 [Melipona bicolor]
MAARVGGIRGKLEAKRRRRGRRRGWKKKKTRGKRRVKDGRGWSRVLERREEGEVGPSVDAEDEIGTETPWHTRPLDLEYGILSACFGYRGAVYATMATLIVANDGRGFFLSGVGEKERRTKEETGVR